MTIMMTEISQIIARFGPRFDGDLTGICRREYRSNNGEKRASLFSPFHFKNSEFFRRGRTKMAIGVMAAQAVSESMGYLIFDSKFKVNLKNIFIAFVKFFASGNSKNVNINTC